MTFVRGATLDLGDAAEALAVLAEAQAATGEFAGARRAIARARELAADIEDQAERARALAEVVQGLSAVGDHTAAVSTARGIGHPAYEGQAMAAAITAAARAGVGPPDATSIAEARAIKDKGWRAVALAAVAVAGTGPLDFNEVNDLIRQGAPRRPAHPGMAGGHRPVRGRGPVRPGGRPRRQDHRRRQPVPGGDRVALGLRAADDGQPTGEDLHRGRLPTGGGRASAAAPAAPLRPLPRGRVRGLHWRSPWRFPADAAMIAGAVARHAAAFTAAVGGRNRG